MNFQQLAEGIPPEVLSILIPRIELLFLYLGEMQQQEKLKMFRDLNMKSSKGGIVFAGDSITEGYVLSEFLPMKQQLYNRGIGGITSKQLLENIGDHILNLMPSKVFLLIGTNDLGSGNDSVEDIADNIRQICMAAKNTEIYLLSVYPVNNDEGSFFTQATHDVRNNNKIKHLNNLLRTIPNVVFIDVSDKLTDTKGNLAKEYTYDGLHLSTRGYEVVTETLLPYIET